MDSSSLNRTLVDRYQEVCQHLLPGGKVVGNHYLVGGLDGKPGESLQVTLNGSAAGRWKDFASDDKGATPLWLWSKTRGVSFAKAVKEAKEWLGIKDDDFGIKKHKANNYPLPSAKVKAAKVPEPNTKAMDYLVVNRRLDPLVVAAAKLGESEDGEVIVIPYFEKGEDEPFHVKRLKIDRVDGKKEMYASTGTRRSLFGKHLIDDNASELNITEGEFDALSLQSVGLPAVSIPNGVSDTTWIDLDWEFLERFERINLFFDGDDAGKLAAPDVCKRLGLHRTHIVTLPFKDANEALQGGFSRDNFLECIQKAKQVELDEIKRASDYTNEVYEYFETDWSKRGWETPWWPDLPWRVRKSEFTILSGYSGSGKTVALNQLMLHLVQQGCKVMDSSLEIKPGMTLYNMTRCALAKKTATRDEIRCCHEWINDSMFFHDCIGTVNPKRLLAAMEYARKRHGIDVFVIDSLFKCGLDPADFGSQREFADTLTTFCNNSGAHVILVAHARKTQNGNELTPPSKSDVAGSSDITNAAFNVIVWWRNKLKKRKLDEARQTTPPDVEQINHWMDQPDGAAIIDKQRFGDGEEAKSDVWFSTETMQFHTSNRKKTPYFVLR
jgi:twinkle protein